MQVKETGFFNSVFQSKLSAHYRERGEQSRRISQIYITSIGMKQSVKFDNRNYRWENVDDRKINCLIYPPPPPSE